MTDNEIIKALERCPQHRECCYCNSVEECGNKRVLTTNALDLINRLQKENDDLFFKLQGVMWSVDKWLDGDELKQDEVNRAITMREKTLQIVEELQRNYDAREGVVNTYDKELKRRKAEIERLQDLIISNDEKHLSYVATKMKKEQELVQTERIRGLEAEVERLKNAYKQCAWERDLVSNRDIQMEVSDRLEKEIKSEAIKEFAERLKERVKSAWAKHFCVFLPPQNSDISQKYLKLEDFDKHINNLVKEMESD